MSILCFLCSFSLIFVRFRYTSAFKRMSFAIIWYIYECNVEIARKSAYRVGHRARIALKCLGLISELLPSSSTTQCTENKCTFYNCIAWSTPVQCVLRQTCHNGTEPHQAQHNFNVIHLIGLGYTHHNSARKRHQSVALVVRPFYSDPLSSPKSA